MDASNQLALHKSQEGKPLYRHLFDIIGQKQKVDDHAAKAAEVIERFVIVRD